MTVVAQEPRITPRLVDVVGHEVQRVPDLAPIRKNGGDEVVHRQERIVINGSGHGGEVPTEIRIERELREVERDW
jgi:hypothetical protein